MAAAEIAKQTAWATMRVRISALKWPTSLQPVLVRYAMKYFCVRTNQSNRALARVLLPSGADRRP